jgi:hypothetical protein
MWNFLLTQVVLPIAVKSTIKYIESSETKKDDKVLEVVQKGASYLAYKHNNTVSVDTAKSLATDTMRQTQKAR